jgi:hypothetical protein
MRDAGKPGVGGSRSALVGLNPDYLTASNAGFLEGFHDRFQKHAIATSRVQNPKHGIARELDPEQEALRDKTRQPWRGVMNTHRLTPTERSTRAP